MIYCNAVTSNELLKALDLGMGAFVTIAFSQYEPWVSVEEVAENAQLASIGRHYTGKNASQ